MAAGDAFAGDIAETGVVAGNGRTEPVLLVRAISLLDPIRIVIVRLVVVELSERTLGIADGGELKREQLHFSRQEEFICAGRRSA